MFEELTDSQKALAEYMSELSELENYAEWERDAIKQAEDILFSEDYIELPSKFDIHEYSIMEKFCLSLDDEELKNTMYYCIKGKGAFGRFKNNIFRYGIEEKWYEYRRKAFREIAKERNRCPKLVINFIG